MISQRIDLITFLPVLNEIYYKISERIQSQERANIYRERGPPPMRLEIKAESNRRNYINKTVQQSYSEC